VLELHILTRKTLGSIETDLDSRVLEADGTPLTGLYAAGEVAGFGGGGVHGYRALEGTFLGGCIFSGRAAGRGVAATSASQCEGPSRRKSPSTLGVSGLLRSPASGWGYLPLGAYPSSR